MANYEKDKSGRFTFKSGEERAVRSFRATSTVWEAIKDKASDQDMNVADYFEALVNDDVSWELEDDKVEREFDFDVDEVVKLLREAKKFKTRQGALKDEKIEEALELMGFGEED